MLLHFDTVDQATVKTERKTITIDYFVLKGIRIIRIKGLRSASACRSRNWIIAMTNTIMSLKFQKSFLSEYSNKLCGYTERKNSDTRPLSLMVVITASLHVVIPQASE